MATTSTLRRWWTRWWKCNPPIFPFMGRKTRFPSEIHDAVTAAERALKANGYGDASNIGSYYPRAIGGYSCNMAVGGYGCSVHGYGLAFDVEPQLNPYYRRPIDDGLWGRIKLTKPQVLAVEGIRTKNRQKVWRWLGWTIGDTMHFQIDCRPSDIATGIDWSTVPGEVKSTQPGIALTTNSDYKPYDVPLAAIWVNVADGVGDAAAIYDAGKVPYIHLMFHADRQPDATVQNIAAGKYDTLLYQWLLKLKAYTDTGRKAVVVYLPEFNGNWTVYANDDWDPKAFLEAWQWFVLEANSVGLLQSNVSFCWAPNNTGYGSLKDWWPGSGTTDIVGGSIYNWGGIFPDKGWEWPAELLDKYIGEVSEFSDEPIVATQIGALASDPRSLEWLKQLAKYSGIDGYIWFNIDQFTLDLSPEEFNKIVNNTDDGDVIVPEGDDMFCKYGDGFGVGNSSPVVEYWQEIIAGLGTSVGAIDGKYGDATVAAVRSLIADNDGRKIGPYEAAELTLQVGAMGGSDADAIHRGDSVVLR